MDCPACLKQFGNPRLLPCGHTYCVSCLEMFFKTNNRLQCQSCKAWHEVPENGVKGFDHNEDVVEKIVLEKYEVEKHRRKLSVDPPPDSSPEGTEMELVQRLARMNRRFRGDNRCDNCGRVGVVTGCGQCDGPNYCSVRCQKKDWNRRHREDCWELRKIKSDYAEYHRRVFLVPNHKEKLALLMSYHDPCRCSKCESFIERKNGKMKLLKKCSSCSTARYCSKKCQVNDWEKHRDDCKEMRRSRSILCGVTSPELEEEEAVINETRKHGMLLKQVWDMTSLQTQSTHNPQALINYFDRFTKTQDKRKYTDNCHCCGKKAHLV